MAAPTMFFLARVYLAALARKINFKRKLKMKAQTNSLVSKKSRT